MSLTRVFRNQGRTLVFVVMALLLVVWLLSDIFQQGRGGGGNLDVTLGTVYGVPVTQSQVSSANNDYELAGSFGISTPPLKMYERGPDMVAPYLLLEEARHMGYRVSADQVEQLFTQVGVDPARIDAARRNTRLSLQGLYAAIGRVLAANRYAEYQVEAAYGASRPRLEKLYEDRSQDATVRLALLDAKAFLPAIAEPTEEELQAHFEKYKNEAAQPTDDSPGFGYRLADRVRIEYLTVDPESIEARVTISLKEAQSYYESNKDKYRQPPQGPTSNASDAANAPGPIPSFEEVKDRVREDARKEKAILEAQRLVNRMRDELARGAPSREGSASQPAVSFEALRERYSKEFPVTYHSTELVDAVDLRRETGFNQARVTVNGRTLSAVMLAFRVEGIVTPAAEDPLPVLKVGEAAPVVLNFRGMDPVRRQPKPFQAYLFRVAEAAPAAPPASLELVREKVRADLRNERAQAAAGEQARKLLERAGEIGLDAAIGEATELKEQLVAATQPASEPAESQPASATPDYVKALGPITPASFTRQPGFIPALGVVLPKLHTEVFALLKTPTSTSSHRVTLVEMARSYRWVLAELVELKPVYQGDFTNALPIMQQSDFMNLQQQLAFQWFDPTRIRERTGFVASEFLRE